MVANPPWVDAIVPATVASGPGGADGHGDGEGSESTSVAVGEGDPDTDAEAAGGALGAASATAGGDDTGGAESGTDVVASTGEATWEVPLVGVECRACQPSTPNTTTASMALAPTMRGFGEWRRLIPESLMAVLT